jgi:hypothetical protein
MIPIAFALILSSTPTSLYCNPLKDEYKSLGCCSGSTSTFPEYVFSSCPSVWTDYYSLNFTAPETTISNFALNGTDMAVSVFRGVFNRISKSQCQSVIIGNVLNHVKFTGLFLEPIAGLKDYIAFATRKGLLHGSCLDYTEINHNYEKKVFIEAWAAYARSIPKFEVLSNFFASADATLVQWTRTGGAPLSASFQTQLSLPATSDAERAKENPHPIVYTDTIPLVTPGYGEETWVNVDQVYITTPTYATEAIKMLEFINTNYCPSSASFSNPCKVGYIGMTFPNGFGTAFPQALQPLVGSFSSYLPGEGTGPAVDNIGCISINPGLEVVSLYDVMNISGTNPTATFDHIHIDFQYICFSKIDVSPDLGKVKSRSPVAVMVQTWASDAALLPIFDSLSYGSIPLLAGRWSLAGNELKAYPSLTSVLRSHMFNVAATSTFKTELSDGTQQSEATSTQFMSDQYFMGVHLAALCVAVMRKAHSAGESLPLKREDFVSYLDSLQLTTSDVNELGLEGTFPEYNFSSIDKIGRGNANIFFLTFDHAQTKYV